MNIKYRISNIYHSIRYAVQRVYRGYDDRDVFSYYDRFLDRNIKIFKYFKANNVGYPGSITETEWNDILQEIIDCLENSDEDIAEEKLFGDLPIEDWASSWSIEKQMQLDEFRERNKNRAFELMSEWFFNLWD